MAQVSRPVQYASQSSSGTSSGMWMWYPTVSVTRTLGIVGIPFWFSLIIPEERACGAVSFSVGSGDRMGVMSVPELHGACTCPLWLGVSIKELL